MKNIAKYVFTAILFTSLLSLSAAQSAEFEVMQDQASVDQGESVDIEFGVFSDSSSEVESTLELLVDLNGDGEFTSEEVVASRSVEVGQYNSLNVTYSDVDLEPGVYSYTARLENGSTYNYYNFADGNLTVEDETDLEPAIEEIELEREQDGSLNVGDTFEVMIKTDSEEVVSLRSDVSFDDSNVKLAGVEPVSSSFYAERQANSAAGVETISGQAEESVDSPEFALIVFEAVEPGSSVINTQNSEIGTTQDTFTSVGEDELEVNIENSSSEQVSVESIEAEIGESTVVEIYYEDKNEEELELEDTNKEAVIEEVAASTNLSYDKVNDVIEFDEVERELEIEVEVEETTNVKIKSSANENLNQEFELNFTNKEEIISSVVQRTGLERNRVEENIDFEREEENVEVEIEVEIGDSTEVRVRSSTRNDLNQEFELSSTDREEVVRTVIERTNLEENVVRKNIEFEKAPVDELGREALIRELKEARDSESSDLKEENERLKKENQRLKRENERLRERLDEEDPSVNSTSENEENQDTVSEGDDVEDEESRDTEVENTSEDEDSQNESDNELTEEEVNFVQRLVSLFQ